MPPEALISSIAIFAPSRQLTPEVAPGPDSSEMLAIRTVSCAQAGGSATRHREGGGKAEYETSFHSSSSGSTRFCAS